MSTRPPKVSLAQQGYEAYTAEMRRERPPHEPWHLLPQIQRDAWAVAVDAILDGWEAMVDAGRGAKE